jgi:hypothetical protein
MFGCQKGSNPPTLRAEQNRLFQLVSVMSHVMSYESVRLRGGCWELQDVQKPGETRKWQTPMGHQWVTLLMMAVVRVGMCAGTAIRHSLRSVPPR